MFNYAKGGAGLGGVLVRASGALGAGRRSPVGGRAAWGAAVRRRGAIGGAVSGL